MNAYTPKIGMRAVGSLRPYAGNARRHSKAQVRQIADSIERFGFTNPVLISIVSDARRTLVCRQQNIQHRDADSPDRRRTLLAKTYGYAPQRNACEEVRCSVDWVNTPKSVAFRATTFFTDNVIVGIALADAGTDHLFNKAIRFRHEVPRILRFNF